MLHDLYLLSRDRWIILTCVGASNLLTTESNPQTCPRPF